MKTGDSHRLVNTVFLARATQGYEEQKTNCLSKCRYLVDVSFGFVIQSRGPSRQERKLVDAITCLVMFLNSDA